MSKVFGLLLLNATWIFFWSWWGLWIVNETLGFCPIFWYEVHQEETRVRSLHWMPRMLPTHSFTASIILTSGKCVFWFIDDSFLCIFLEICVNTFRVGTNTFWIYWGSLEENNTVVQMNIRWKNGSSKIVISQKETKKLTAVEIEIPKHYQKQALLHSFLLVLSTYSLLDSNSVMMNPP